MQIPHMTSRMVSKPVPRPYLRLIPSMLPRRNKAALAVLLIGTVCAGMSQTQNHQMPNNQNARASQTNPTPTTMHVPETRDAQTEQTRKRVGDAERRKRMIADTDRLLTLSTELKAEVDKLSPDDLSVAVTRKATEAEKLAREIGRLNKQ